MNTELVDQAPPCSDQRRRIEQASDGSTTARIVAALYSRCVCIAVASAVSHRLFVAVFAAEAVWALFMAVYRSMPLIEINDLTVNLESAPLRPAIAFLTAACTKSLAAYMGFSVEIRHPK
jgi:hypothetical protein